MSSTYTYNNPNPVPQSPSPPWTKSAFCKNLRERRESETHLDEPGGETIGLKGRVGHSILIEIGIIFDADFVDSIRDVGKASRSGKRARMVGRDVVEPSLGQVMEQRYSRRRPVS
jgi:hypothetical protein